jgi:hypothetical protein
VIASPCVTTALLDPADPETLLIALGATEL